jgi:sec-independent protein translocase protein TatA
MEPAERYLPMNFLAFLHQLGPLEIILIFFVILLLFGAKRLPELFRSFGTSLREFKKATSEIEEEVTSAMESADLRKGDRPKTTPAAEKKASAPVESKPVIETEEKPS